MTNKESRKIMDKILIVCEETVHDNLLTYKSKDIQITYNISTEEIKVFQVSNFTRERMRLYIGDLEDFQVENILASVIKNII